MGRYGGVHGGSMGGRYGDGRDGKGVGPEGGGALRKGEGCTGLFEYLRKGGKLMECV